MLLFHYESFFYLQASTDQRAPLCFKGTYALLIEKTMYLHVEGDVKEHLRLEFQLLMPPGNLRGT